MQGKETDDTCDVRVALSSSLRPKPGSSMSPCTAFTLKLTLLPWCNEQWVKHVFLPVLIKKFAVPIEIIESEKAKEAPVTSLCQKAVRREVSQVWTLGKLHAWLGSGGTQSGLLCSYDGEHEEWGTGNIWNMRCSFGDHEEWAKPDKTLKGN